MGSEYLTRSPTGGMDNDPMRIAELIELVRHRLEGERHLKRYCICLAVADTTNQNLSVFSCGFGREALQELCSIILDENEKQRSEVLHLRGAMSREKFNPLAIANFLEERS